LQILLYLRAQGDQGSANRMKRHGYDLSFMIP
jgi:hypothetical protein